MATLRHKQKIAAVSRDIQEIARNGQSQNTFVPEMTEEYITQVSDEKEGTVIKKLLSQEFSRTESRVLGALSKLDEFLLNPQVRTYSGTVPTTSQNNFSDKREPTGDRSLKNCSPKLEFSVRQATTSVDSDREETFHNYFPCSQPLTEHAHVIQRYRKNQKFFRINKPGKFSWCYT